MTALDLPLEGTRVIAIETGASGPFASRLLADFGADVIKVEPPGGGDVSRSWDTVCNGISAATVWLNRNKRSVVLDLKAEEDLRLLLDLVAEADIVVENFRPGSVEKLGIGYEALKAVKPDLIYGHISGFGRSGPYREAKAYDMIIQGESGLMSLTGSPDDLAKVPISICDLAAGKYAALTALAMLNRRHRTGEGGEFEVSMLEAVLSLFGTFPHIFWHRGKSPPRTGARHHMLSPYGPYEDRDGQQFSIAVLSPNAYETFCRDVIKAPELVEDERFCTNERRVQNRLVLEEKIGGILRTKKRAVWLPLLKSAGIPCGVVNDLGEALDHPQLKHMEAIQTVETAAGPMREFVGPVRIDGHALPLKRVPGLGEHTQEVLSELAKPTKKETNTRNLSS